MAFSSTLKKLREEKGLSQKDIAEYLGITRQAVASYELAKREPDYDVLKKLADYFSVSVDYLLGRAKCRDVDAITVGKNIALIRGGMTYKELSEDISQSTGAIIFPEMLEQYEAGERMPFIGTLKIIARYCGVRESFFYVHNTLVSYQAEQLNYKNIIQSDDENQSSEVSLDEINHFEEDVKKWLVKVENVDYIILAKSIQEAGIPVDTLKPLIGIIKDKNSK